MPGSEVLAAGFGEDGDAEETRHPVQVVLIARHGQHFRDHRQLSPVSAELLHLFL